MAWSQPDIAHLQSDDLSSHSAALSVVSLNLAKVSDAEAILAEWNRLPSIRDADIILLQEVVKKAAEVAGTAELLAAKLNRSVAFASPEPLPTTLGIAIISRYPISSRHEIVLPKRNLVFRSRSRNALLASVETPLGLVRVAATHLDTRENPDRRAEQLAPILQAMQPFEGPAIVGGDLNTNSFIWFASVLPVTAPGKQAQAVERLFRSFGFATPLSASGPTFDHLGMQLDWIYTRGLRSIAAGVQPVQLSDHHAVRSVFVLP